MSETPEISIIMANYNCGPYLGAAIESVRTQTFGQWELIFVDDASRDDSVDIARSVAAKDPRIVVIRQKINGGPAASRNEALRHARGRWIAIFDSDDLMLPNRLEMLRNRALSDGAEIVADNLLVFSADNPARRPFLPKNIVAIPRWIDLAGFVDSNRLYSRTPDLGYLKPFVSRKLLQQTGVCYDETLRIGEDYEFMARLLSRGGARLRLEPEALYLYRKHAGSISHRLRADAIIALIEADERLVHHVEPSDRKVALAFRKRGRSLKSMLLYEQVIALLKTGHYGQAVALSFGAPRIWPLLTQPMSARIRRLAFGRPG